MRGFVFVALAAAVSLFSPTVQTLDPAVSGWCVPDPR
jgi:hypothetical protein